MFALTFNVLHHFVKMEKRFQWECVCEQCRTLNDIDNAFCEVCGHPRVFVSSRHKAKECKDCQEIQCNLRGRPSPVETSECPLCSTVNGQRNTECETCTHSLMRSVLPHVESACEECTLIKKRQKQAKPRVYNVDELKQRMSIADAKMIRAVEHLRTARAVEHADLRFRGNCPRNPGILASDCPHCILEKFEKLENESNMNKE